MIPAFGLKPIPEIIFGTSTFGQLGEKIHQNGTRPLLVLGNQSFMKNERIEKLLQNDLIKSNIVPTVSIKGEPAPEMINSAVKRYGNDSIDLVIAIGGGSVLDGGKAISAMLAEQQDVTTFLEGVGSRLPSGDKIPFIAVPTTAGTGSEMTSNAVISSVGKTGFKKSLRHNNYIPNLALVDPKLTASCPPQLTAASGMDCFTQLVEGYLSTNGSVLTDALAFAGIEAIGRSLKAAYEDGDNLSARTDIAYAALLSGIVLANAGLGTIHGFASCIGGLFSIPHGVVCGTIMAPSNSLTLKRLREQKPDSPSLSKYTKLGKTLSSEKKKSDNWYQDSFIDVLFDLTDTLDIPRLGTYGISSSDIVTIVSGTGNKYNPVNLNEDDLAAILASRM